MNKIIFIILISFILCLADDIESFKISNFNYGNIITKVIKGHEYLISIYSSQSGICIIHSESCICHNKPVTDSLKTNLTRKKK